MADEELQAHADRERPGATTRSDGGDAEGQPAVPVRDPEMLTIEEVARVLDCPVEVAQTIADRGILPHDDIEVSNAPPGQEKVTKLWRRSRAEWHKKLRDAEVEELGRLMTARPEKKPLKKRSR